MDLYEQRYKEFYDMYRFSCGIQQPDINLMHRCFLTKDKKEPFEIVVMFIKPTIHCNYNKDISTYRQIFFSELDYLCKLVRIIYVTLYRETNDDHHRTRILDSILEFIEYISEKEAVFETLLECFRTSSIDLSSIVSFGNEIIFTIRDDLLKQICINYDIQEYTMCVYMDDDLPANHNIRIIQDAIYVYIDNTVKRMSYKRFRELFVGNFQTKLLYLYNVIFFTKLSKEERAAFRNNILKARIEYEFTSFYNKIFKPWLQMKSFFVDINI